MVRLWLGWGFDNDKWHDIIYCGTSVSIISVNLTGNELTILGQTNIWIKFKHIKKVQEIEALVRQEDCNESLIGLDSLQDMGIIHKDFPFPMNKTTGDTYYLSWKC